MKETKKWLKIIGNIFIWAFVAFAVAITIIVLVANADDDRVPSINGKSFISILTDSMSPTFKKGDLIISEKLEDSEKSKLQVGDIITYYVDLDGDGFKELNSHRIVSINDNNGLIYYTTQGDNTVTNPTPDAPVFYGDVICRYTGTKISGIGGFLNFLQTKNGFLFVIVIPLILFFLYELCRFIFVLVEFRSKKASAISPADEEEIKRRAIEEYLRSQQAQSGNGSESHTDSDKKDE